MCDLPFVRIVASGGVPKGKRINAPPPNRADAEL